MKKHFLKITGNQLLIFETLNTYLIEIEAILNSQPITPISADTNDLIALTSSHFLIENVLTSTVERRWRHNSKQPKHVATGKTVAATFLDPMVQGLLEVRSKWNTKKPTELQMGAFVIVKGDNTSLLLVSGTDHSTTRRPNHKGDDRKNIERRI